MRLADLHFHVWHKDHPPYTPDAYVSERFGPWAGSAIFLPADGTTDAEAQAQVLELLGRNYTAEPCDKLCLTLRTEH